ncbi:hypothetical protein [Pseudomonas sp. BMS12]|uniref:hypothetical protein n=1 Tax=Pseudomonas sp. BMS12 TaxID=1796033 RepID=UPI00083AC9C1|nr:hypothetical protein [Pseudomonas sp. BMS12]
MPTSNDPQAHTAHLQQPHKAGDIETFPGGQVSYLAPLPLPTGHPAQDYGHAVGEVNDTYLDFGVGLPHIFGWQVTLGFPFSFFLVVAFLLPVLGALLVLLVGGMDAASEALIGLFKESSKIAIYSSIAFLALALLIWFKRYNTRHEIIPTRFNRQRCEICVVPEGHSEPIFVPWETHSAWVIQAQGATQYGVQRQYAMGVGFHHAASGKDFCLEFPCSGLPLAISNWEAVRAYMEYEVHSLKEIQDPLDLQGPGDPPHEGLHTFRNARVRIHRRYRAGEVGGFRLFAWYLYHLMTLWTLPARLTEWEIGAIKRMHRQDLPPAMQQWSQPLPPEQWAKPSAELQRLSEQVRQLRKRNPQRPIIEIFAEVQGAAAKSA